MQPLVSVIVTCHNYGRFLGEAIESALDQTHSNFEVLVIDDGSTDDTALVASRYTTVKYIYQENQGVCSARNRGLRESKGTYLVFLDADDRLMKTAFEVGARCLDKHPECAFVWGSCELVALDGSPLPTSREAQYVEKDYYLALLRRNSIWNPAMVMFRRRVFDTISGFDDDHRYAEDYELYLRIAKDFPVYCHGVSTVRYRIHGKNNSRNLSHMLPTSLKVLYLQYEFIKGNKQYVQAYRTGIKFWQASYGSPLIKRLYENVRRKREWAQTMKESLVLLRYYRIGLAFLILRLIRKSHRLFRRP